MFPLQNGTKEDLSAMNICSLKGHSKEQSDKLYANAYYHYQNKEYQKATPLFRLLAILHPFDKTYWIGLGACHQAAEEFSFAIRAYANACLMDFKDPNPHVYMADCYLALENYTEALKAINTAHERAQVGDYYDTKLLKHIEDMHKKCQIGGNE